MSNFEERLLSALKDDMASENLVTVTPARRGHGRLLGLAAAVTGAAAAATLVLYGGTASPAFAVEKQADGSIEVRISEFRDPEELERRLRDENVNADVTYLPAGQTCKAPRGRAKASGGRFEASVGSVEGGGGIVFKIKEGEIIAGQTLVMTVSSDPEHLDRPPVGMALEVVEGTVGPCEVVPMPLPTPGKGEARIDKRDDSHGPGTGEEGRRGKAENRTDGPGTSEKDG
ncbi:hypothetical protein [Nonomuraea roseola]|uniref:DUF5666 domain-containing protein n=1 Tax=Nonomuraea roseola TaxID=46179 RepID=A0ABV5QAM4_9ACTN